MSTSAVSAETPFEMKSVGRQTIVYGLGVMLNKAVAFLMLPVYTRYLTPADYGVMELISMTLEIISILAGAQIALGIFRYYYKADTAQDRDAVVSTALLGLAISYMVVAVAAYLSAAPISTLVFRSADNASLIRIAAISFACQGLSIVPLAYLRVRDRSALFVAANAVKLVVGLAFNVLFLIHLGMGVRGVLLSNLIANLIVAVWLTSSTVRSVGLRFSRRSTRDLLRYGIPMIGTWMAAFIVTYAGRYFLQAAGSETDVGLYALAGQFGFLLALFGYIPFMQVWEQKRFEIAKRPDRDALLSRGFIYLNVLLITVAVAIALFVGDVLGIMAAPAFHAAAQLVPVVLIAYVLQGWSSVQDVGILVRERTELVSLANWIAAIIALVAFVILVPRWMGWGAAIGTAVAFAVRHVILYVISQRLWPVRYAWAPVLRLVGFGIAVSVAGMMLPPLDTLTSLAMRAMLFSGYVFALWFGGVLTADERRAAQRVAARWAGALRPRRPQSA